MEVTKRKGGAQRIVFVLLLTVLAVLQFENVVKVADQVRQTASLDTPLVSSIKHVTRPLASSTDECLHELGKNGTWIQDWNFAKNYGQYKNPLVIPPGPHVKKTWGKFVPSSEAPFRYESSFRWHDFHSDSCQIDYTISSGTLCETLQSLKVTRMLFFGDSLTQSMAKSLLNKMDSHLVHKKPKPSNTTESYHLICDPLNVVQLLLAKEGGGHGSRSNPARLDFYFSPVSQHLVTSNPERTLSIYNIGAHYHALQEYKEDFDSLLDTIDRFQRPNDLVFFRTTVPGHKGCSPRRPRAFNWTRGLREVPLKHFDDYKSTSKFGWNLFFDYNHYSKRKLAERSSSGRKPTIELLDVTNMTILRQDGHVGGVDCLHYYTPGPIDWWIHLLFTFLKAMASPEPEAVAAVQ